MTFGIRPTRPETAYGYILPGEPLGGGLHAIARSEEKPTLRRAETLRRRALHYRVERRGRLGGAVGGGGPGRGIGLLSTSEGTVV